MGGAMSAGATEEVAHRDLAFSEWVLRNSWHSALSFSEWVAWTGKGAGEGLGEVGEKGEVGKEERGDDEERGDEGVEGGDDHKPVRAQDEEQGNSSYFHIPELEHIDLCSRFECGPVLGRGTYGAVVACEDRRTAERVACKGVPKRSQTLPTFQHEAESRGHLMEWEAMAAMKGHPNIVEAKGVFQDHHYVYYIMELCEGGSLLQHVRRKLQFPEEKVRIVFEQICRGVAAMHAQNIMHRDLKLSNILVKEKGVEDADTMTVKIADFGSAVKFEEGQMLRERFLGTSVYLAPEMVKGGMYDKSADVWSLGVILYRMLGEDYPFVGATEEEILKTSKADNLRFEEPAWGGVSSAGKDLVRKLLSEKSKRPTLAQILQHRWIAPPVGMEGESGKGREGRKEEKEVGGGDLTRKRKRPDEDGWLEGGLGAKRLKIGEALDSEEGERKVGLGGKSEEEILEKIGQKSEEGEEAAGVRRKRKGEECTKERVDDEERGDEGVEGGDDNKPVRAQDEEQDNSSYFHIPELEHIDLCSRFECGPVLGRGTYGAVVACEDRRTAERVACKGVPKRFQTLPTFQHEAESRRLLMEWEAMAAMKGHPNIVEAKGVFQDHHYLYYIMELCEGGSLLEHVHGKLQFPEEKVRSVFEQICRGVAAIHAQNIMHRDLRLPNILVKEKGVEDADTMTVKIADFGLAVKLEEGQMLRGRFSNTSVSTAPEMVKGEMYDKSADVWSLGVILYRMLGEDYPFVGAKVEEIVEASKAGNLRFEEPAWGGVSSAAKDLVRKLLSEKSKRPTLAQILQHRWIAPPVGMEGESGKGREGRKEEEKEVGGGDLTPALVRKRNRPHEDGCLEGGLGAKILKIGEALDSEEGERKVGLGGKSEDEILEKIGQKSEEGEEAAGVRRKRKGEECTEEEESGGTRGEEAAPGRQVRRRSAGTHIGVRSSDSESDTETTRAPPCSPSPAARASSREEAREMKGGNVLSRKRVKLLGREAMGKERALPEERLGSRKRARHCNSEGEGEETKA